METAVYVLFAAVIATGLHALAEPLNLKKQLLVLGKMISGKKHTSTAKMKLKPNPISSAIIATVFMLVVGGISYVVINAIEPDVENLLFATAGFIVVVELINTVAIDRIHAIISSLKDNYR